MSNSAALPLAAKADGGASSNDFLMQWQADSLNRPVQRAGVEEVGALAAAAMAFAAMGQKMPPTSTTATHFLPQGAPAGLRDNWHKALARARL